MVRTGIHSVADWISSSETWNAWADQAMSDLSYTGHDGKRRMIPREQITEEMKARYPEVFVEYKSLVH